MYIFSLAPVLMYVFYKPIYSCLQWPINRGSAWIPRLDIQKRKVDRENVTLALNKLQQNSMAEVNSAENQSSNMPYQYLIILQRKSSRRGKASSTLDVCSSLLHNLSATALALGLHVCKHSIKQKLIKVLVMYVSLRSLFI